MPFTKQLNKDFYIKDNRIHLSDEYYNKNKKYFKKITGSRFASILRLNQYASPVQAWCTIVNIYKEDMDPTLANVGNCIEPKVRDYVSNLTNIKFKTYIPSQINWNVFEDDVFGGIPDGEPINDKGEFAYSDGLPMLEIKTSSEDKLTYEKVNGSLRMKKDANGYPVVKEIGGKKKTWFLDDKFKISNEYCFQLLLYLHLRKAKNGMFAVTFLKPEDYVHPENFDPKTHEIHFVNLKINDEHNLEKSIEYGRKWYKKYVINNHFSMSLDENDKKWLQEELGNNVI